MTWKLRRTRQCAKCPWKVSTDPYEIPGYDPDWHANLAGTIALPGALPLGAGVDRVMACHEHDAEDEVYCVGWLVHQLGPGNNIGLRLRMRGCENANQLRVDGPQHARFEDTLPEDVA